MDRSIVGICSYQSHALHNFHPRIYSTEYRMQIIQEGAWFQCDKKLRSVRVGPRIRHAYNARTHVLEVAGDFVFELATVNGFPAPPRPRRISALHHKIAYYTVENSAVEVARVRQCGHVITGPRCVLVVQLNDKSSLCEPQFV